jgi:hypothetical protein
MELASNSLLVLPIEVLLSIYNGLWIKFKHINPCFSPLPTA